MCDSLMEGWGWFVWNETQGGERVKEIEDSSSCCVFVPTTDSQPLRICAEQFCPCFLACVTAMGIAPGTTILNPPLWLLWG